MAIGIHRNHVPKPRKKTGGRKAEDLSGKPFGDWIAVAECAVRANGRIYWFCRCKHNGVVKKVIAKYRLVHNPPSCKCVPPVYPKGYKRSKRSAPVGFERAQEIRAKCAAGDITQTAIAAEYGVTAKAIFRILAGETYRVDERGKPVPRKEHSSKLKRRLMDDEEKEHYFGKAQG